MATITERPDRPAPSKWAAVIRRKGYPTVSKSFPSRAEAVKWSRAIESDMDRGTYLDDRMAKDCTLGDLLERYAKEVSPLKRGHEVETIRIASMRRQKLADWSAANLTGAVIANWRDDRLKHVSGSTVNRDLNLIGHVIETARKEWGLPIRENPVRLIRRPKSNPWRERRLMPEEEVRLLLACGQLRNEYMRPLVLLALETAMRRGELLSLEWQRIEVKQRRVHLITSKNGKPRGIPLTYKAIAVLESIGFQHQGRVFEGVTPSAVVQAFGRAAKKAGLIDFRFHDLRHEATSRLFEKGLNPIEVASITGHSGMVMLQRYTHLSASDLAKKLG